MKSLAKTRIKINLKNATGYAVIYYYLLTQLFFWTVSTHTKFGIAAHSLNITGVWIGSIFCFLTTILLIKHLFYFMVRHFSSKEPIPQPSGPFNIAEKTFNFFGWCFLFATVMVYLNSRFDSEYPGYYSAKIMAIKENKLLFDYGPRFTSLLLDVNNPANQKMSLVMTKTNSNDHWNGEPLKILIRHGDLGLPWIEWYERDDATMSKEVLKEFPNAAMAWKNLLRTYMRFGEWTNLSQKGLTYLKLNPSDYSFFETIASFLTNASHDKEALPFYEHVISHIPSAKTLLSYGIGLHNSGNNKRAVSVLEQAVAIDPNDSEIYFFLGVAHYDLQEWKDSLSNFQKVLEFRPNFPQVEGLVSDLKKKLDVKTSM
ncbi:MAG: tetratricopeptide repeat protein [Nitrospirae bacterium]|nr:tetratricopeptide repeat protein [Nitrospirota bacterium]MBI3351310.1 tetratricopeptide repeat protein [Nitrospirota bacterium]